MKKTFSLRTLLCLSVGCAISISLTYYLARAFTRVGHNGSIIVIEAQELGSVGKNRDYSSLGACEIHFEKSDFLCKVLNQVNSESPSLKEMEFTGGIFELSSVTCVFRNVGRLKVSSPKLSIENSLEICRIFPAVTNLTINCCELHADSLSNFRRLALRRLELVGPVDPNLFNVDEIAQAFKENRLAPELVLDLGKRIEIEKFACDTLVSIDIWNMEYSFDEVSSLAKNSLNLRRIIAPFSLKDEQEFQRQFPSISVQ